MSEGSVLRDSAKRGEAQSTDRPAQQGGTRRTVSLPQCHLGDASHCLSVTQLRLGD